MKNLKLNFTIFFLLVLIGCSNSTKGQVPEEVKTTFKAKYPGETDPDWHKDKNGNFESHFKIDGKHYRADFSPTGNWIETERSIDEKDLPEVVKEAIKLKYKKYKIDEIEEVQHAQKGLFYDVEFKIDGDKKDVEFNSSGAVIN